MNPSSGPSPLSGSDRDYRLLVPFLLHTMVMQALVLALRICTSYRAIELGLSITWLGIIATGFALLPVFCAMWVGRWIDKGNDARAVWVGATLIGAASIGFWAWATTAFHLLAWTVLLGFGQMFCLAGHQTLSARAGGVNRREASVGNYLLAASLGQGLGSFAVGLFSGSVTLPPTSLIFAGAAVAGIASVGIALLIPPSGQLSSAVNSEKPATIGQLFAVQGFRAVMVSSVITITATDLLVIFLPVLGTERQIEAYHIGMLLTVRAIASLVSRIFYARLIRTIGRWPLTVMSMILSATTFALLAIPLSPAVLYGVVTVLGFAMGIASTLTLSSVMYLAPVEGRGTALTLRMTGNRVGQVVFPAVAGVLAAATGAGGILVVTGFGLALSGLMVGRSGKAASR